LVARPEVRDLPQFIFGQSMGGAIALKAHLKQPNDWDGVILVAPMCKVCPFLSVAFDGVILLACISISVNMKPNLLFLFGY
jgi:acylglycerol lipase